MRGLWVDPRGVVLRDDLPRPAPPPRSGEARVRVRLAGVCATDLALARGYMGFEGVPGHEFVGEALDGPLVGRRVVGEINAACGRCPACAAGLGRHCPERTVLGILGRPGAFAEELALPATNLHPVPDGVPDERAVFVEPLAAALEIAEQVPLAPLAAAGERALVLGDGRLGLLCAHALALSGVACDVVGRHPERAELLPDGAEHLGEGDGAGPRRALVVEATGDPDALGRALALVRPRGTVVLKTTCERPARVELAPLVVDEVTLVGSRCGPFGPALAALAAGRVRPEGLVAARLPLAEAPRALARAAEPGTLKVLIDARDASRDA